MGMHLPLLLPLLLLFLLLPLLPLPLLPLLLPLLLLLVLLLVVVLGGWVAIASGAALPVKEATGEARTSSPAPPCPAEWLLPPPR